MNRRPTRSRRNNQPVFTLYSFSPQGYDGVLVRVEVDIRRGIPGIDIVGLPDAAIRESRERIRVSVRNAGFRFPQDRVLVNLAPGDVKKAGSHFDLPIAISILAAANAIPGFSEAVNSRKVLIVGELDLAGEVHGVRGVLAAVARGLECDLTHFLVPEENYREASALNKGIIMPVSSIRRAVSILTTSKDVYPRERKAFVNDRQCGHGELEYAEMSGSEALKRAIAIAVAGRHHALLFGAPGSGKTMALMRIPSILPSLSWTDAVSVTKIHSLAGTLGADMGLISCPPVRAPHHSASIEGLIGGGRDNTPGEVSLAHHGVLLLDEACEFRPSILQSLREPVESKQVTLVRAGSHVRFPSDFQLVLSSNACPCGNFGRDDEACLCSRREVQLYWKRLGGPLLDRIDIRFQTQPPTSSQLFGGPGLSSGTMKSWIERARMRQIRRFYKSGIRWNRDIPAVKMKGFVDADAHAEIAMDEASTRTAMSARSYISVMRLARTIADIDDQTKVTRDHVEEAIGLRRLGDGDLFWR